MTTATGILPDQKLEKQIEKQMGCMTGFLQIFDRHQILTGKRLYATKRLTPSPPAAGDSTPLSEKSVGSPMDSRELHPQAPEIRSPATVTPEIVKEIPVRMASSSSSSTPLFNVKESLQRTTTTATPWKFREAPRLSLDSRATVDGKGSLYPKEIRTTNTASAAAIFSVTRCQTFVEENDTQRRRSSSSSSPSVIAKLMGLEALPATAGREPIKKVELRRSASESRVSRDLRFDDTLRSNFSSNCMRDNHNHNVVAAAAAAAAAAEEDHHHHQHQQHRSKARLMDDSSSMEFGSRNLKSEPQRSCFVINPPSSQQWNSHQQQQQQRKSFYDSHQDFFPEPKQNGSLYGEIEKRLKMRGIDEPEKDLETLKQILEALQLKGLLHSKKPAERITNRNFVFDRRFSSDESPIVIMKPARSNNQIGRRRGGPPEIRSKGGINRDQNLSSRPRLSRTHNNNEQNQNQPKERRPANSSSPDRNENNAAAAAAAKSPSSLARRRQLNNIDTQRRGNVDSSRSPIHSPKVISPRKTGSDHHQFNNKSPRNRKPNMNDVRIFNNQGDDDSSAISESSFSTSSQIDTEFQRTKMEDYKEGRSLLERCDKLLHSIAEITSSSETTTELQPSPVSVLDSSFYKDESSPSPVLRRRCIDFKDHQSMELDEEMWSPMISPMRMKFEEITSSEQEDSDFIYVSEILGVSECISDDNTDVFLLLEKRRSISTSSSSSSSNSNVSNKLHRRLVFDTVMEILDRKTQLPPWKTLSKTTMRSSGSLFKQVWSEFEKIRERESTDQDLFEVICGALKKDMAGDAINGWVDCPVETSEAVLDIERLIFKDLVAETIRDLADFAGKTVSSSSSPVPPPRRTLVF